MRITRSEAGRLQELKGMVQTPGRLMTHFLVQFTDYLAGPNPLQGQLDLRVDNNYDKIWFLSRGFKTR